MKTKLMSQVSLGDVVCFTVGGPGGAPVEVKGKVVVILPPHPGEVGLYITVVSPCGKYFSEYPLTKPSEAKIRVIS